MSIISHSIAPRANVSYVDKLARYLVASCLCAFIEASAPAVLSLIIIVTAPPVYGKDGDPTDSLSRYQASLEACCYDNMEKARTLWVEVMSRHGKQAQYWMEYASIERCIVCSQHLYMCM